MAALELPPAVFKTCPWQPREVVETGLTQWLRCCAVAMRDGQAIGMPSHAVDEAWHGLILCTARYQTFCAQAYGQFLHHHPTDGAPAGHDTSAGPMDEQLRRTVIAWELVALPGEHCILWDLDSRVGVAEPWGIGVGGCRDPGRAGRNRHRRNVFDYRSVTAAINTQEGEVCRWRATSFGDHWAI